MKLRGRTAARRRRRSARTESGRDSVAHGVQVVLECGDDAEVAPPPRSAQNRSSFSFSVAARIRSSAVTTRPAQVVAREAVPARQVSDPAAEREPAHAGRGDDAARRGQPVLVGGVVERAPGRAAWARAVLPVGSTSTPACGRGRSRPRRRRRRIRGRCATPRAPRWRRQPRARGRPPPPHRRRRAVHYHAWSPMIMAL